MGAISVRVIDLIGNGARVLVHDGVAARAIHFLRSTRRNIVAISVVKMSPCRAWGRAANPFREGSFDAPHLRGIVMSCQDRQSRLLLGAQGEIAIDAP